ncbi:MAG: response regulator transcription factor [Clostridiales bacterium]|nr:response regulator transcription factor [Clostridiales bacterium]
MKKIYVVEDDEDIRELVFYTLKSEFEVTGFSHPSDFWRAIRSEMPDLVLLDIMLPGEDGISILNGLKSDNRTRALPVIMLTAKTGEFDRVKGLDLGADDYITKPFSILELTSRIKAVLRRSAAAEGPVELIEIGLVALYPEKRTVTVCGETASLTYKEFELLRLFMENQGTVLSRDKIMLQIWGTDFEGETRTVDMHVKTLRHKLGDGGDIIKTVRGVGYKAESGD